MALGKLCIKSFKTPKTIRDYLQTFQDFLQVPSPTGQEKEFGDLLYTFLNQIPHDSLEMQAISPTRFNVLLTRGTPRLTLTSHMDTVPTVVPVQATSEAIFGRGACDAKGQIVAQIYALNQAISQGLTNYACFYVVGEEVNSAGAIKAMESSRLRGTYVLNGEPTGNTFVSRCRGVIELKLTTVGKAEHTSKPNTDSALHKLIEDLQSVVAFKTPNYSLNIGKVEGGIAPNVSAPDASALACVRIQVSSKEAMATIKSLVKHAQVEMLDMVEPLSLYVPPAYQQTSVEVPFSSDSSYYTKNFEHVMLFGPGSISEAHTNQEHMTFSDMNQGIKILTELLLTL